MYRKLDAVEREIRVLVLQHGRVKDGVQCMMRYISLVNRPLLAYETISYVWGDATVRGTILLDNVTLDVPKSSETVLRRMRLPKRDRIVWIDAMCINQTDVEERNQQVAMMADIYGNTAKDLIWLGHPPRASEAAQATRSVAEVAYDFGKHLQDGKRFVDAVLDVQTGRWKFPDASERRPVTLITRFMSPLLRLFESAWFTRLWDKSIVSSTIVQEAALAPVSDCYFSDSGISLLTILRTAAWLSYHQQNLPFAFNAYIGLKNVALMWAYTDAEHGVFGNSLGLGGQMSQCLSDLQDFEAHDPRDHVYALLGVYLRPLKTSRIPHLLQPDYGRPVSEVLRDAAIYTFAEDETLRCFKQLELPSGKQRGRDDTPSWVPCWGQSWAPGHGHERVAPFRSDFQASGKYTKTAVGEQVLSATWHDLNVLYVRGCVAGGLTKTWPGLGLEWNLADRLETLTSVEQELKRAGHGVNEIFEMIATT